MFEEIIGELRQLEGPHEIRVSVALDEKGYFDRVCGSTECGGRFKVLFKDFHRPADRTCVWVSGRASPASGTTEPQGRRGQFRRTGC